MIRKYLIYICFILAGCSTLIPSSSFFSYEKDASLKNPEVVVKNDSDKNVKLTVSSDKIKTFTLKPFTSKKLSLPPAKYTFHAKAKGVLPSVIYTQIEPKKRYFISLYMGKH